MIDHDGVQGSGMPRCPRCDAARPGALRQCAGCTMRVAASYSQQGDYGVSLPRAPSVSISPLSLIYLVFMVLIMLARMCS